MATLSIAKGPMRVASASDRQNSIAAPRLHFRKPLIVKASSSSLASTVATSTGNGAATAPAPAPITVNVPPATPALLGPPLNFDNVVNVGAAKAKQSVFKTIVLGIYAGVFVAYGGFFATTILGNVPALATANPGLSKLLFGLVFPVGLLMVTICGAELYTGNTAVVTAAVYEGKATVGELLQNWFLSYFANFVGSILMVAAVHATGLLAGNALPVNAAVAKCSLTFSQAFLRAVLCNFLVCVAVWQGAAASTLPGKVLGLWAPITTFVTIGLEHSIANMFFVPLGILMGAKVTFADFVFKNLIPVTLGNTFAGVVFMAGGYWLAYGKPSKAAPK